MAPKPKIVHETESDEQQAKAAAAPAEPETPALANAPDPFDLDKLRLPPDFGAATGVVKLINVVPVRKKPDPQDWVRVRPEPEYRGEFLAIFLNNDREWFLVTPEVARAIPSKVWKVIIYTAITRQGTTFLWVVRLPEPGDRINTAHTSNNDAAQKAMTQLVQMEWNNELKAYEISISQASNSFDPEWPNLSFKELMKIAFVNTGRFVTTLDHPVVKQLLGFS